MKMCVILFLATALTAFADVPGLKVSVLEKNVIYLQIGHLPDNFAEQLKDAQPTNHVSGTILDLRFAEGEKSVSAENLFFGKQLPLIILVNGQTRGAAVELVARLRMADRGIVIGSTNVTGKITPDIAIAVNSEEEKSFQENPFAKTSKSNTVSAATNDLLPFVDHTSEAELVSKRAKDGELSEPQAPRIESAQPVIRDPALARALDLLKALAVLHSTRG